MHYGIYTPNFGPYGSPADLAALACDAEAAGWDGFFLWDHIAGGTQPILDPWVTLAVAAMQTRRLRLGTTVTPLPRRRPWKLARETASLDRLSGGRLMLGVGIGLGHAEWGDLGEQTDTKVRGAMLDEGLEVLTRCWSGEAFSYAGDHYRIKAARFMPTPVQSPRPPVWVGGMWPNKVPFRRMARWDGMFPLFEEWEDAKVLPLLREALAFVREERATHGVNPDAPFDVAIAGETPGDTPAVAAELVAAYAEAGVTWWLEAIAPYRLGLDLDADWPMDALRERIRQGPPRG